jgi:uncharacterized membrane protein
MSERTLRPAVFLKPEERQRVEAAIAAAEQGTSGEIRVVISERSGSDALAAARRVFRKLRMQETKERNAVLILLAVKSHRFAIYGDEGIDALVGAAGWEAARDAMASRFRERDFVGGLVDAVEELGRVLKEHFPAFGTDPNELPNEVVDE